MSSAHGGGQKRQLASALQLKDARVDRVLREVTIEATVASGHVTLPPRPPSGGVEATNAVDQAHGVAVRKDGLDLRGTQVRGWEGVGSKQPAPPSASHPLLQLGAGISCRHERPPRAGR